MSYHLSFQPLCARQEICSIVRTSPCQRPPRLCQIPVSSKAFSLPEGVPEGNSIQKQVTGAHWLFECLKVGWVVFRSEYLENHKAKE